MKTLRKLFFGLEMTWVKTVIFALLTAFLTAGVLMIPGLKGTSFVNIGTTFECWILFALIVILNCNGFWEAGLKVFLFFLISQPLIYLLQVPTVGWEIFRYYPRWALWTVACLPGGMIAWRVKKGDLLSGFILSVATASLAAMSVWFFGQTLNAFPHQLVSSLFCLVLAFGFPFVLLQKRGPRAAALAVTLAALIVAAVLSLGSSIAPDIIREEPLEPGMDWYVSFTNGDFGTAEIDPSAPDTLRIVATDYGTGTVRVSAGEETVEFSVSYTAKDGLIIAKSE